jgi:hypothetical protein
VGVGRALTTVSLAAALAAGAGCASADPRLVGSGSFAGGSWRVLAEMRGDQICISTVVTPGDSQGLSCVVDDEASPLTTHGSVGGSDRPRILHGLTQAHVAAVEVELDVNPVHVPTVLVPAIATAPNSRRGFAVALDQSAVLVAITALDAAGTVLDRYETGT